MPEFTHNFKNDASSRNDSFLPKVFDLSKSSLNITVTPESGFKVWSLGLACSKIKNFRFPITGPGRFDDQNLRFYIVSSGYTPGKVEMSVSNALDIKELPQQLSLNPLPPNVSITFGTLTEDKFLFTINVGNYPITTVVPKDDFRYVKLFAWAENEAYEINCSIKFLTDAQLVFFEKPSSFLIEESIDPALQVDLMAASVSNLLLSLKQQSGNLFGIFGDWGRGKTFFWNQIWIELKKKETNKPTVFKVEFHAWKYQDTPAAWAYLYEQFADQFIKSKLVKKEDSEGSIEQTPIQDYFKTQKVLWSLNLTRLGASPIINFFLGTLLFLVWFLPDKFSWLKFLATTFGIIICFKFVYFFWIYQPKAWQLLQQYFRRLSFKSNLGLQAEIQKELAAVLKNWIPDTETKNSKVILFVDDIDRCSEERIVQVVDALKVMLEDEIISQRVIIVIAIDERVLQSAITLKYRELFETRFFEENSENIVREYLDKLFISGIRLGNLSPEERLEILEMLTKNKVGNIPSDEANQLTKKSRKEVLKQSRASTSKSTEPEVIEVIDLTQEEADENFEIGAPELDLLEQVVEKFEINTPRSIRIFYYRYLLAKKIMNIRFQSSDKYLEQWNEPTNNKLLLPVLIIWYASKSNVRILKEDIEVIGQRKGYETINVRILEWSFNIRVNLYLELLLITQTVVPY